MRSHPIARSPWPWLLAFALAIACGDAAAPDTAPIEIRGGDRQSAVVGSELPAPLEVRATDGRGQGVPGIAIRFTVVRGDGTVEPGEAVTDEQGRAVARWTLGTTSGEHRVSAEMEGAAVTFRAYALPGPAATIASKRDTIIAFVDDTVSAGILARDAFGNPIIERYPSWTVSQPRLATLSAEGMITGLEPGVATLAAELDGVRTEVPLVVTRWASLTAGYAHTCGLTVDGRAYCWGGQGFGELGSTTGSGTFVPVPVRGNLKFAMLTAGDRHTCGLTTEGVAYCWGDNSDGQLGTGVPGATSLPQPVLAELRFRTITAGGAHTCALTEAGEAYCWGSNASGQLGTGDQASSPVPVPVQGGGFAELDGHGDHHCGRAPDGSVHCWGMIYERGSLDPSELAWFQIHPTPGPLPGGPRFERIAVERFHGCGLAAGGAAYCWGENSYGQLGTGNRNGSTTPVAVSGGRVFRSLSVGAYHTCGVAVDGTAYCWGFGTWGQLGTETGIGACTSQKLKCALTPVRVALDAAFSVVAAGYTHTCGITDRGVAYCWGFNRHGQAGSGKGTVHEPTPVRVPSPR